MNSKDIIKNILDENPSDAKFGIEAALYEKVAEALVENTPSTVERNFQIENSVPLFYEKEMSPEQKAYRELFDRILKKYGVDSPNDLEDSKKDDFFNEVEREWKKDPANDNEGPGEEGD